MKKIVFFVLLLCFITVVNAEVDCNKLIDVTNKCTVIGKTLLTLKPGDVITCEVSFKSQESETCTPTFELLKEINFNISTTLSNKSNEITGSGFTKTVIDNSYKFTRETGIRENSIYKYDLTMPNVTEDTNYSVSISNISVVNNEDLPIGSNLIGNPVNIRVLNPKSTINTLSKLNVSTYNLTPRFSSDILNYTLTVDTNVTSVNIVVEATDPTSIITGDTGEKPLVFGTNTFKIYVKSEMDVTKTYTVVVTRTDRRSSENGLSTLTVSNTFFEYKFDKDRYDLEVDKEVTSVKINSTLIDPKSSYVEGFGPSTKTLVVGTNTFYIKVKAENDAIKTYTIVIVKNDGKSSVNSLATLKVKNFDKINYVPETLTYSFNVSSLISEVEIESTLMSTKSTYVEGFGNRKVKLVAGLNKIDIKVKSEKGVIKTYTINITREDPKDNTNLKELSITDVKLDFKNDDTEYEFEVSYLVEKLDIKAKSEEDKTVINIIGNEKLVVGKNIVKIELTSESGKKKEYNLIVMKREKASNISKLKNITIENYEIEFDSNTLEYQIKINDEKELKIIIEKLDPLSIYSIIGNNNLKSGSEIVINSYAEDGTLTAYKIKVSKDIEFLLPLIGVTALIFIISVTASKKKNVNIIKKKDIKEPTTESKKEVIQEVKPIVKKDIIEGIPELEDVKKVEEFDDIEEPIEEIAESNIEEDINKEPIKENITDTNNIITEEKKEVSEGKYIKQEIPKEETKKEDEILEL